jgi:hypothetical protein
MPGWLAAFVMRHRSPTQTGALRTCVFPANRRFEKKRMQASRILPSVAWRTSTGSGVIRSSAGCPQSGFQGATPTRATAVHTDKTSAYPT